ASLLVCAYALSVLFYVLSTPELGVRCAFSPVVNHFYPEFSYLKNSGHLWEGDRIVQVADQPIVEWSQLLHKLKDLQKDLLPAIDEKRAAELTQGDRNDMDLFSFSCKGEKVVRVLVQRCVEREPRVVWLRLGRPLPRTLVPSILWF